MSLQQQQLGRGALVVRVAGLGAGCLCMCWRAVLVGKCCALPGTNSVLCGLASAVFAVNLFDIHYACVYSSG